MVYDPGNRVGNAADLERQAKHATRKTVSTLSRPSPDWHVGWKREDRLRAADKHLSLKYGVNSSQEVTLGTCFYNVRPRPQVKSFLDDVGRGFLTQEDYLGFRGKFPNLPCGSDSIQGGESDVKQYQIRLQFFRFLNGFQSIRCFTDYLQFWLCSQGRAYESSKGYEVLHDEDAH